MILQENYNPALRLGTVAGFGRKTCGGASRTPAQVTTASFLAFGPTWKARFLRGATSTTTIGKIEQKVVREEPTPLLWTKRPGAPAFGPIATLWVSWQQRK